jgi:excisionase family DNA binding protein
MRPVLAGADPIRKAPPVGGATVTGRRTVEVDAHALRRLIAAAAGTPDPAAIAAALADLLATGTRTGDWLDVPTAANLLGVHPATVRRAAARGDLDHLRVGRRLLIARPTTAAHPSAPERTRR